jgi:carbonic anhydrase/acetyltransferase-like protein (isoleucine patch superfamily)
MPDRHGPIRALGSLVPRIAASAFVAPTATVIGDVEIGEQCGIWFGCVLRGDEQPIRVGARSNIQDNAIVHITAATADSPGFSTTIGEDVTIGHGAIIHACVIEDWGFVGMGATVLDGAVIERGGMLAAGGLLTPGKRIAPGELWQGSPARFSRVMTDQDRERFAKNAPHYVGLAARFKATLRRA